MNQPSGKSRNSADEAKAVAPPSDRGISRWKLALGAASLFFFVVGVKRSFRTDDGREILQSDADLLDGGDDEMKQAGRTEAVQGKGRSGSRRPGSTTKTDSAPRSTRKTEAASRAAKKTETGSRSPRKAGGSSRLSASDQSDAEDEIRPAGRGLLRRREPDPQGRRRG